MAKYSQQRKAYIYGYSTGKMRISLDRATILTAVVVLVVANIFHVVTGAMMLCMWLIFFGMNIFFSILVSRISYLPNQIFVDEHHSVLTWACLAVLFSSSPLVAWRGAIAGYLTVSILTSHMKTNIKYWHAVPFLGRVELIVKCVLLLTCSVLQWVYYHTLSSVDGELLSYEKEVLHIALVASFSCMADLLQLLLVCALLIAGPSLLSHRLFHIQSDSLAVSLLDPLIPGFYLIPTILSRVLVIGYSLILSLFYPSLVLDLVIAVAVYSFFKTRESLVEFNNALRDIPLVQAEEETQCCICLVSISHRERARRLPCQHLFHSSCLRHWIADHPNCPICRKPIRSTARSSAGERSNSPTGNLARPPAPRSASLAPGPFPVNPSSLSRRITNQRAIQPTPSRVTTRGPNVPRRTPAAGLQAPFEQSDSATAQTPPPPMRGSIFDENPFDNNNDSTPERQRAPIPTQPAETPQRTQRKRRRPREKSQSPSSAPERKLPKRD